jgi:hypothetical protein
MFASSLIVLVFQNDLGASLLFFGLFVMMFYCSTEQVWWVVLALTAFAGACALVYTQASHVQVRVEAWLDPFANYDRNTQIIEAQFGFAWGGLLGRGWGMGLPGRVPLANSDFIAAAIGEELGLVGLAAVIVVYAVIVARGLRAALMTRDSFGKLLAAGLSFVFALQVFAIVGGVTRLLPLTGLTTPFMSQGGSSLLANWLIVAVLLLISHQGRRPAAAFVPAPIVDLQDDTTQLIPSVAALPVADVDAAAGDDALDGAGRPASSAGTPDGEDPAETPEGAEDGSPPLPEAGAVGWGLEGGGAADSPPDPSSPAAAQRLRDRAEEDTGRLVPGTEEPE